MPSMELKDRLQNLTHKVDTLRKRFLALQKEKKEMERTIERQELEIAKLEKDSCVLPILFLVTPRLSRVIRSRLPIWCGTLTVASNN